jgi:putative protease
LGVSVHASSVAGAYNSKAVSFFRRLGAERVILPRDLTLAEIRSITKSCPDMEFEVFILYNRCLYSDGFCTFLHGDECFGLGENACTRVYDIRSQRSEKNKNIKRLDWAYHTREGVTQSLAFQCGLCALHDLAKWGVYSVKIVGRAKPLWMREYGVKMIGNLMRHIEEDAPSRREFIQDVRRIVESTVYSDVKRPCTDLNCFYPEEFL